jgi:hypothetical protein
MTDGIDAEQAACPNCATPLAGRYCAACGQKTAPLNPTIGQFLREVWRSAIVGVLSFAALVAAMAAIFLPPILDVINGSQT